MAVQKSEGQALVQMALLMTVLLCFAALAIDVGHIYHERRQMQNAADAGALAGAQEICFGTPAQARAVAEQYAQANASQGTIVGFPNTWTVVVTATETTPTMLLGIVGMDQVDVRAVAEAKCGQANRGCGLWPIAFDVDRWNELACGAEFYVWSGDNINQDPDCTVYECDVDGINGPDVLASQARAWIDFSENVTVSEEYPDPCSAAGCGESELECWIRNDSGGLVTLPTCLSGDNGVKAGVKDGIASRIGDLVSIPLYDSVNECGAPVCPGGNAYEVSGFGCIQVLGWEHNFELPRLDGSNPSYRGKFIRAAMSCGSECATYCGGTSGGPPLPTGLKAVSMTR